MLVRVFYVSFLLISFGFSSSILLLFWLLFVKDHRLGNRHALRTSNIMNSLFFFFAISVARFILIRLMLLSRDSTRPSHLLLHCTLFRRLFHFIVIILCFFFRSFSLAYALFSCILHPFWFLFASSIGLFFLLCFTFTIWTNAIFIFFNLIHIDSERKKLTVVEMQHKTPSSSSPPKINVQIFLILFINVWVFFFFWKSDQYSICLIRILMMLSPLMMTQYHYNILLIHAEIDHSFTIEHLNLKWIGLCVCHDMPHDYHYFPNSVKIEFLSNRLIKFKICITIARRDLFVCAFLFYSL